MDLHETMAFINLTEIGNSDICQKGYYKLSQGHLDMHQI